MAFSQGSRHGLSYVVESAYGTTPSTPTMKALRNTSVGLVASKDSFQSEEIRSDRQIVDLRHGTRQTGGDIGFELSYGAFDDLLESALQGAWSTNVLKAGTTLKSFTAERRFEDIAQYQVFTGCIVNTMSLTITPNAMVTGSFGILGKDASFSGSSLGNPTAAPTHPPFDAFTGALEEGGSAIATVTSIELNLDNGMSPAFVIGSAVTPQLIVGRSNLTGTITAYFDSLSLLNKFLNETESSLSVTLDGASGGDLVISIPRLKYSGGSNPVTGSTEAVMLSLPFQALRSAADGTNLVITRVPA
jgi:hypothetical protein